jgi:TonB family protein
MTPLKDTLEVANPATETSGAVAGEHPKSDSGGLRSDAVSLDVPVKVHGSRVTEVVRGITPHTEPFEEQTSTMIVFPQGGVLRMTTAVTAGQMVVLTNLKTGHDAICRVVKVRAYAQSQSYVEVEFTNRQQGYWGVKFATDSAEPVRTILPPPPALPVVSTSVEFDSDASASRATTVPPPAAKRPQPPPVLASPVKPTSAPQQPVPNPQKSESSFVSIGAQEDVQPAATATTLKTRQERPVAPAASLSMAELRGDAAVAPPISTSLGAGVPGEMTDLSEALEETARETAPAPISFPDPASASPSTANPAPQKVFGARFDSLVPTVSENAGDTPATSGTNWFLIATGVAALLVVAVGGAFYFHVLPGAKSSARIESAPPAMNLPATSSSSGVSPATAGLAANSAVAPVAQPAAQPGSTSNSPGAAIRTIEPAPVNANRAAIADRAQPLAQAQSNQKPAKAMPDISASLTAHPVSSQRVAADDAEPAPSVDAGASPAGELQGIASAPDVAPPPAPAAPAIKIGGAVEPPRLVSSVMPIYPPVAKSAGVAGRVVLEASVNTSGVVVATKVLSGPAMLRQAAVDALRRWKYQPATLNGSPVAVDITVTMSFRN